MGQAAWDKNNNDDDDDDEASYIVHTDCRQQCVADVILTALTL